MPNKDQHIISTAFLFILSWKSWGGILHEKHAVSELRCFAKDAALPKAHLVISAHKLETDGQVRVKRRAPVEKQRVSGCKTDMKAVCISIANPSTNLN